MDGFEGYKLIDVRDPPPLRGVDLVGISYVSPEGESFADLTVTAVLSSVHFPANSVEVDAETRDIAPTWQEPTTWKPGVGQPIRRGSFAISTGAGGVFMCAEWCCDEDRDGHTNRAGHRERPPTRWHGACRSGAT